MPISEPEWLSITKLAEKVAARVSGKKDDYFVTGKVLKVDEKNRCVYMREFGDQAIPIVGFDYEVKYYDDNGTSVSAKKVIAKAVMPKRGDTVLVAREMGTNRLPRCLGVLQGKNWIVAEDD